MVQINNLRSGAENQILNPGVDYSTLPKSTSHNGHSGTSHKDVELLWKQVTALHPESMKVRIMGIDVDLKANWSISGKSVFYIGSISREVLESVFHLASSKTNTPTVFIQRGNIITVSNGQHSFIKVCPSLVEILY